MRAGVRPDVLRAVRSARVARHCGLGVVLALLAAGVPAAAQVLPGTSLPPTPLQDRLPPTPVPTIERGVETVRGVAGDYAAQVRDLLREAPTQVRRTPQGDPMLRGEYLALDATADALQAARAAGFEVIDRAMPDHTVPDALRDLPVPVLLRDRRDRAPARALRALRAAMPAATVEAHHLYLPAGGGAPGEPSRGEPSRGDTLADASPRLVVGLIDGGVDAGAPALSRLQIERHGCGGRAIAQDHGTRVALRLAGQARGRLYAADLWCGERVGGGTLALVEALRWMAQQRVPVINISLIGPDNPALRRMVEALHARGHVLVAAAGNDGPAAPPRYPAGYVQAIAVAAVDTRGKPLAESAAGAHIDLCAPGMAGNVRGTSYAAPLVARVLAQRLDTLQAGTARDAAARLPQLVVATGRGRNARCGLGVLRTVAAD